MASICKISLYFLIAYLPLSPSLQAVKAQDSAQQQMLNVLKNFLIDNEHFCQDPAHNEVYFKRTSQDQKPRATVVACADSRLQTATFDANPLGDVFFVRNIGNQLATCLGSIDYGVLELHTPLLLILGHSYCGAIKAVTQGLEKLPISIQNELKSIDVLHKSAHPTEEQLYENVKKNVHDQISKCLERYSEEVKNKKLWIVGAIYDFSPKGKGKLKIVQVNDQTSPFFLSTFFEEIQTLGNYLDDPGKTVDCVGK